MAQRRRYIGFLSVLVVTGLFVGPLPAQDPAPEAPFEGKRISTVRYAPDTQPYSLSVLDNINPVKPGDNFAISNISLAIERLYETGRFADIDVNANLVDGEVVVEFQTKPSWFVGRVTVNHTSDPPNESQLIGAARLELGQEFTEDYLLDSTQNVLDLLRSNGFYRAAIEPRMEYDALTQQVSLHFEIAAGKRARFTQPLITGQSFLSNRSIVRATRWRQFFGFGPFKPLTETRLQSGLERIRYSFQKRDFLMAKVALDQLEYLQESNRVRPHLRIDAGPRVRIRTDGARLSTGRLRQLVPVYQERAVDRDLLVEGMRNITTYLQGQGFFDAEVEFHTTDTEPGVEQEILYQINRGPRYKLVHLEISGNSYFDDNTIAERIGITPATRIRFRNGRFSEELLRKDIDAIEYLYRSNGFRDVHVVPRVEKGYQGDPNDVAVFIEIQEGPQWFVESVEIDGVNLKELEYVQSQLQTVEGQPFSEVGITVDRDVILNYYFNSGFPDATLEYRVENSSEPQRVRVKFTVTEGRRNFVRRVMVSGYQTTQPRLIFDRIPLETGDPLSQSAITDAQRRLYDLGIFAKVDTALQNPQGKERDKNVLYRLEEASRYSYTVGFGAQLARIGGGVGTFDAPAGAPGFSPRFSLGVSRSNFWGLGHTLGFRGLVSSFQQRAVLNYLAPQFTGNDRLSLSLTTLYDNSRDVRTFEAERLEGSVQLSQRLSKANTLQYRFTFRRVRIDEGTLVIDPSLVPLFSQPVRLGIWSASFVQDKRDDPIASRRGSYNTVDFGFAGTPFGSQSDFFRLLYRNSTYHRLGRELVLARSTTLGGMYSLSGSAPENDVPLPERYFSGGGTTHRGFPDNQAGPRDLSTGFPLGGKALLMNSVELRFPLIGDAIGGVLFHDAGNVYKDLSSISFRVKQRDITDFDYMVHAVGFGVRYRTPVGPVRFDLAYSVNPPSFYGFRGTLEELVSGGGIKQVQRISRFQFHFSLGQTF